METLPKIPRIGHGTQDTSKFGRVGVQVDALDRGLLARLATPPIRIVDKEQLFLRKEVQPRQVLIRFLSRAFFPRLECRGQPTRVGDVLAQREFTVHVQGLVVRSRDREVGVLVDEALGSFFEVLDRGVGPPVREVAVLIVVTTRGVKGVREFVARDGAERAIAEVLWHVHVKNGELHDSGWEDDFVAWGVVVFGWG